MDLLQVILIIVGVAIIIISFRLVDVSQENTEQSGNRKLPEVEIKQWKDNMNQYLSEVSEEMILHTEESLSKISNEKIMAVSEYSDQILEKIKCNHEEVVFLYNMLNDKEKELKSAIGEIDASYKKLQDMADTKNNVSNNNTGNKKAKNKGKNQNAYKSETDKMTQTAVRPDYNKENTQEAQNYKEEKEPLAMESEKSISNRQILSLYSQGKTVVEISRQLGLGQGEVKLVIDLFHQKK